MGIYAFGDCVRRIGLGRFATVVELRIPCVYAWGVSTDETGTHLTILLPDGENFFVCIFVHIVSFVYSKWNFIV